MYSEGCQDNALLVLRALDLKPIGTALQAIPPSEQAVIIRLMESINALGRVEGDTKRGNGGLYSPAAPFSEYSKGFCPHILRY